MKRVFNLLGNLGLGISLLVVIAGFVALPFYGVSLAIVLSESMTPALKMAGVIGVQKADFSELKVGDIIQFRVAEETTPVVHRIIEKVETEEGVGFKTKGDAAEEQDPWLIKESDFLGKVVFHIPWIGYLNKSLKTQMGFLLAMGLPAAVALVLILKDIWKEPEKTRVKRRWRQKPDRFPAYLSLAIGLILAGAFWGMMVQNIQEENLGSFARKSQESGELKYLAERQVHNKGGFPLVIVLSSEDKGIEFSQTHFWLSPGQQKSLKITGDFGEAIIKSGALLPILPQETLYQLFSWNSQLGPLLAAAIPILPLTLIVFLVLWKLASRKPSFAERAKIRERRLSYG